jgi:hypothetical protein
MNLESIGVITRRLFILCSFIFISVFVQAQCVGHCTTVTATLTDSSTQVWANATVSINIIAPFGNPSPLQNNGAPIASPINTIQTNGSGVFTISLDDNTQVTPAGSKWHFTMCPNATIQNCSQATLTIAGASESLTTPLSSVLIVPVVNSAPTIYRAYSDAEANGGLGSVYWNTTSNTFRGCAQALCNGSGWTPLGGGGSGLPAGTTGELVTYNLTDVGVATPNLIDNTQGGGVGVTFGGPETLTSASFQFYDTQCPSTALTLIGNLVGFGSGTDCNPYWGNSSGVFPLYTAIWGIITGSSPNTLVITTNPPITSYGPGGLLLGFCPGAPNIAGGITINAGAGVVNLESGRGATTTWPAGTFNVSNCDIAQWDGTEFQLVYPYVNTANLANCMVGVFCVTNYTGTADAQIIACNTAAVAAGGGICDARGYGASVQSIVNCPIPLGGTGVSVGLLVNVSTTFNITCNAPTDYTFHGYTGSYIRGDGTGTQGFSNSEANFQVTTGNVLGVISNWPRVPTGNASVFSVQNIALRSNVGSTIGEGLISLSGIFSASTLTNVNTVYCGGGNAALYVTAPTTGSFFLTSDVTVVNSDFDCGGATNSGHACEFKDGGSASGLGSINFYGSQCQHSTLSELDLNGNGSLQCGAFLFSGFHTESTTGLATTPPFVTISDCHDITFDNWNSSGAEPTSGNIMTVGQVTANSVHDIFIKSSRFYTATSVVSSSVTGLNNLAWVSQPDGFMDVEYYRGLPLYPTKFSLQTFSTYPTCTSATEGMLVSISDSTVNTWGATITGSGSDQVLGYCDGANWTVAGK